VVIHIPVLFLGAAIYAASPLAVNVIISCLSSTHASLYIKWNCFFSKCFFYGATVSRVFSSPDIRYVTKPIYSYIPYGSYLEKLFCFGADNLILPSYILITKFSFCSYANVAKMTFASLKN